MSNYRHVLFTDVIRHASWVGDRVLGLGRCKTCVLQVMTPSWTQQKKFSQNTNMKGSDFGLVVEDGSN